MTVWSVVSAIIPFVGLATLWAAIHYAKQAALRGTVVDQYRTRIVELSDQIFVLHNDNAELKTKLKVIENESVERQYRYEEASAKISSIQQQAAELARKVANDPNIEYASRMAAEKLKEILNGK